MRRFRRVIRRRGRKFRGRGRLRAARRTVYSVLPTSRNTLHLGGVLTCADNKQIFADVTVFGQKGDLQTLMRNASGENPALNNVYKTARFLYQGFKATVTLSNLSNVHGRGTIYLIQCLADRTNTEDVTTDVTTALGNMNYSGTAPTIDTCGISFRNVWTEISGNWRIVKAQNFRLKAGNSRRFHFSDRKNRVMRGFEISEGTTYKKKWVTHHCTVIYRPETLISARNASDVHVGYETPNCSLSYLVDVEYMGKYLSDSTPTYTHYVQTTDVAGAAGHSAIMSDAIQGMAQFETLG